MAFVDVLAHLCILRRRAAGNRPVEIETEIISTEVNGAIAYVVLLEKLFQVIGGQKVSAQSMATNIFEQMGQEWYIVHHHGSPIAR